MDKITEGAADEFVANEFVANEFVVATPYRDLVLRRLTGTGAEATQHSAELDLSLITLTDVWHAAEEIRRQREADDLAGPHFDGPGEPHDLERLLAELRTSFARRYDGWIPTMGKNRVMRGIQLFPFPAYIGEDRPRTVSGSPWPRR